MSRIENKIEKKSNRVERYKNPYFWIGLGGVILTSLQVEASTLTTWASVGELVIKTASNPFLLGTTAMAILGVVINPSTKGIVD
ncbi:phage holin [Peptostreptococcus anaerobius]|uniref:phage holin n=1 Tax=Peptostreptococcus anaerobius TaxID=1261 RepID=UPI00321BBC67